MAIIESLLPVFLLIGLGAALTAGGFFSNELLQNLNRVAYWVGMPGLMFASVSEAQLAAGRSMQISLVLILATIAGLLVAWLVARVSRLPAISIGTLMQAGFRGNLAFIGLPLTIYVFSRPDAPASAAEMAPVVALAIAPVMITYNVLGVAVLIASHHRLTPESLTLFVRQVLTNPLVLSIAAGLICARAGWQVPGAINTTIKTIGGLAIPAALFGVGGKLVTAPIRARLGPAISGALLKVGFVPLAGFLIGRLLGLPPVDVGVAVLLCATPTAAAAFIMTTQLRGDAELASSIIALSTIGSAASLAVAIILIH